MDGRMNPRNRRGAKRRGEDIREAATSVSSDHDL